MNIHLCLCRWAFFLLHQRPSVNESVFRRFSVPLSHTLIHRKHHSDMQRIHVNPESMDLIFTGSMWISTFAEVHVAFVFLIFVLAVQFSIILSRMGSDSQTIPFPGGRWGVNVSAQEQKRRRTRLAFLWVSWGCAVCQVRGVTEGWGRGKRRRGVMVCVNVGEVHALSFWFISLRGEMMVGQDHPF